MSAHITKCQRAAIYFPIEHYGRESETIRRRSRGLPGNVAYAAENADAWYKLGVDYAIEGESARMREVYQALRELDRARAELYFNTYILP